MREVILSFLDRIEKVFNVKVLYAVESGSRAWGFESTDSDYNVRVIYVECPEYYLGVPTLRSDLLDVPELRTEAGTLNFRELRKHPEFTDLPLDLDIDGFEFRKAAAYAASGKPVLIEWLGSPVVYLNRPIAENTKGLTREFLKEYMASTVNHYTLLDHYWGLVTQMLVDRYPLPTVKPVKKLLYAIRCLGAMGWLYQWGATADGKVVFPIEFDTLRGPFLDLAVKSEVVGLDTTPGLVDYREHLDTLLRLKAEGTENVDLMGARAYNELLELVKQLSSKAYVITKQSFAEARYVPPNPQKGYPKAFSAFVTTAMRHHLSIKE